jgi:mannose-1-phosphate guanylyltransferase / mannose-6-phosphate isomerase
MKVIPIILSGGSGTRLWPLSRENYPKQYINLLGGYSMLQETILRLNGLINKIEPIIVCNHKHRFIVAEQLNEIQLVNSTIILEPSGRNTAAAITAAAIHVLRMKIKDAILLVLSADHNILDKQSFHESIEIAVQQAQHPKLVVFGVTPTHPNTGYGYLKIKSDSGKDFLPVDEFVEKPSRIVAEKYIQDDHYFWNSGMFVFEPEFFINELSIYSKDIVRAIQASYNNSNKDLDFIRLEKKSFESSPDISIDYALMEKSKNVVMVPLNAEWSDVGSWKVLSEIEKKDSDGNVIKGDVVSIETKNTYINAQHKLIATIGLKDLIIVDTPDATLIANRNNLDAVKNIVAKLKNEKRIESGSHRKVYRPWGWYDTIEIGDFFQVKKLYVKPGAKLSLQLHHKRAEHWVVVKGTATVINNDNKYTLDEGESTYISLGAKHSLENMTTSPLEVIEVQSGTYLGEDDIVRFEDIYDRIKK